MALFLQQRRSGPAGRGDGPRDGRRALVMFFFVTVSLWVFVVTAGLAVGGDSPPFDRWLLHLLHPAGDLSDPIGPAWLEDAVRAPEGPGKAIPRSATPQSAAQAAAWARPGIGSALVAGGTGPAEFRGNLGRAFATRLVAGHREVDLARVGQV